MSVNTPVPEYALALIEKACKRLSVTKVHRACKVSQTTFARARGGHCVEPRIRDALVQYAETYARQYPGEKHDV